MHYLSEYSTFENTQQLNAAIYEHIRNNTHELNETDRLTLKLIARYCVKYAGACHLKAATIANLIEKSEKTARRVIAKLEALNIVEKIATTRKVNGGKGANIIRILSPKNINDQSSVSNRQESAESTESKDEPPKNEQEPSDSIKQSKSTLQETPIPSNALRQSLPTEIYDAMARYWNAADIYKYYGILLRAKRSVDHNVIIEDNAEPFVDALHNAILKVKLGKVKKLANYLFTAWQNATSLVTRRRERAGMAEAFADWING
jgi:hypothetical protein